MKITRGQMYSLINISKTVGATERAARLYLVSQLLEREIETFKELSLSDWRFIRERAFPNWFEGDWEVCHAFMAKATTILNRYREDVLGQLSLLPAKEEK